jgi:hypothetical protein
MAVTEDGSMSTADHAIALVLTVMPDHAGQILASTINRQRAAAAGGSGVSVPRSTTCADGTRAL